MRVRIRALTVPETWRPMPPSFPSLSRRSSTIGRQARQHGGARNRPLHRRRRTHRYGTDRPFRGGFGPLLVDEIESGGRARQSRGGLAPVGSAPPPRGGAASLPATGGGAAISTWRGRSCAFRRALRIPTSPLSRAACSSHLLAIAQRLAVAARVADILVERGDQGVLQAASRPRPRARGFPTSPSVPWCSGRWATTRWLRPWADVPTSRPNICVASSDRRPKSFGGASWHRRLRARSAKRWRKFLPK